MTGPGNRGTTPARLFGVANGRAAAAPPATWEREVRRTLAAQVERVPPPAADLAGRAVAQARRVRRRHRIVGLAAVVVATMLAAGALVQGLPNAGPRPGPGGGGLSLPGLLDAPADPTAEDGAEDDTEVETRLADDPAVAERVATDVIGAGLDGGLVLATTEGRAADLGPIREVVSAHRVGDGWAVVAGDAGTARLWWVAGGATPVPVLSGMDAIVVENRRVAWRRGSVLATGVLAGSGGVEQRVSTRAPEGGGQPAGFAGDAVLLARTGTGEATSWDVWRPAQGDYHPAWSPEVVRIYGALPGRPVAVGLVASLAGKLCLAEVNVADRLGVGRQACGLELPAAGSGTVSPDGRWLAATAGPAGESGPAAVMVDLAAAFAGDRDALVAVGGVPAPTGRPVWLAPDRVVFPAADGLARVRPEQVLADPDAVDVIDLFGETPVLVQGVSDG